MKCALISALAMISLFANGEELVSKSVWGNNIVLSLSEIYCRPDQKFMSCYQTDATTCTDATIGAAETCLEVVDAEVPDMLDSNEQNQWATVVAECTAAEYENAVVRHEQACEAANPPSKTSKSIFKDVQFQVQSAMCQAGGVYIKCFKTDSEECQIRVDSVSNGCFAEIDGQIPDYFTETESIRLAEQFGICVATTYANEMLEDKKVKLFCAP